MTHGIWWIRSAMNSLGVLPQTAIDRYAVREQRTWCAAACHRRKVVQLQFGWWVSSMAIDKSESSTAMMNSIQFFSCCNHVHSAYSYLLTANCLFLLFRSTRSPLIISINTWDNYIIRLCGCAQSTLIYFSAYCIIVAVRLVVPLLRPNPHHNVFSSAFTSQLQLIICLIIHMHGHTCDDCVVSRWFVSVAEFWRMNQQYRKRKRPSLSRALLLFCNCVCVCLRTQCDSDSFVAWDPLKRWIRAHTHKQQITMAMHITVSICAWTFSCIAKHKL